MLRSRIRETGGNAAFDFAPHGRDATASVKGDHLILFDFDFPPHGRDATSPPMRQRHEPVTLISRPTGEMLQYRKEC